MTMLQKTFAHTAICLLLVLFFASCVKDDPSSYSSILRVRVGDSPTVFGDSIPALRDIFIDIRRIEVAVAGSEPRDESKTEEWHVLEFSGSELNVFTIMNGRLQQIVEQWFPANKTIRKIKVVFGGNSRLVNTAERAIPLHLSDELRDGFVIIDNLEIPITMHTISSLVVEINTRFGYDEESERFILDPRVRAFSETFGGSLRGTIAPPESRPFVQITNEKERLFATPQQDGQFVFLGLEEGEWTIFVRPNNPGFRDTTFVHKVEPRKVNTIDRVTLRLIKPDPEPEPSEDDEDDEDENENENEENGESTEE